MAFNSRCLYPDKSVPLGKYWRTKPLVFLLVPRCQGLCGSVKKMWIASRWANRSCSAVSFPRIIGQCFPQQRGHVTEFLREDLSGTPRIRPVHLGQDDQARRPLDQGADGQAIARPLEERYRARICSPKRGRVAGVREANFTEEGASFTGEGGKYDNAGS